MRVSYDTGGRRYGESVFGDDKILLAGTERETRASGDGCHCLIKDDHVVIGSLAAVGRRNKRAHPANAGMRGYQV